MVRLFQRRIPVVPILVLLVLFGYYLHLRMRHASITAYGKSAVIAATDAATGIRVSVSRDGRTLVASSPDGKMLWTTDVMAAAGLPSMGKPVIFRVFIQGDTVVVTYGFHAWAYLSLRYGNVTWLGED